MQVTKATECNYNSSIIRASIKLEVECTIMKENSSCFHLAYSSPIFKTNIFSQIDSFGEKYRAQSLIFKGKPL